MWKWFRWVLLGLLILLILGIFFLRTFFKLTQHQSTTKSTSTPSSQPTSLPSSTGHIMTKEELIDYFVAETTTVSGVDLKLEVIRWEKPNVTISQENAGPSFATEAINSFIEIFNRNSQSTKLSLVPSGGDIKVTYYPKMEDAGGKAGPSSGADAIIDEAYIHISLNEVPDRFHFSQIFDHEMMHTVGFMGHYDEDSCPLMTNQICGKKMTQNEEKLIWMLYSSGIPIDIGESQIRAFFQNVNI